LPFIAAQLVLQKKNSKDEISPCWSLDSEGGGYQLQKPEFRFAFLSFFMPYGASSKLDAKA